MVKGVGIYFSESQRKAYTKEDKIFGISSRAKAMIAEKGADNVINATIGSLLDDKGELVVLASVDKVFKSLSPVDYADYAPIGGLPSFREAVIKAAFGRHKPEGYIRAVSTPGGTGSLRNVISNYSDGRETECLPLTGTGLRTTQ